MKKRYIVGIGLVAVLLALVIGWVVCGRLLPEGEIGCFAALQRQLLRVS